VFWLPRSAVGEIARVARESIHGPIEVNASVYQGHVLWGFSRRVLRDFFGLPPETAAVSPTTGSRDATL